MAQEPTFLPTLTDKEFILSGASTHLSAPPGSHLVQPSSPKAGLGMTWGVFEGFYQVRNQRWVLEKLVGSLHKLASLISLNKTT